MFKWQQVELTVFWSVVELTNYIDMKNRVSCGQDLVACVSVKFVRTFSGSENSNLWALLVFIQRGLGILSTTVRVTWLGWCLGITEGKTDHSPQTEVDLSGIFGRTLEQCWAAKHAERRPGSCWVLPQCRHDNPRVCPVCESDHSHFPLELPLPSSRANWLPQVSAFSFKAFSSSFCYFSMGLGLWGYLPAILS